MSAYTEIPKIIAENGELPPKVLGDLNTRYPGASSQSVEYWVAPPPLGNDNNDGSEDYPLATLAAAVAKLPDIIRADHEYSIILAPGDWDEELNINHILVYGKLTVRGSSGDRERHKVRRVRWDSVIGYSAVSDLTTTIKTASGASFWFNRCAPHLEVTNVKAESDVDVEKGVTGAIGLLADFGSQIMVQDSDFGGKRYGIRSNYLSRVFSKNNTGEGSTFGVGARWGGILNLYGTQPTGDTNITNDSGGLVVHTQGGKVGLERREPDNTGVDERFLIDRWETDEGTYARKMWAVRSGSRHAPNQRIPAGSSLRVFFRHSGNTGQYLIDAKMSYMPNNKTSLRFLHTIFHPRVTETSASNTNGSMVASHYGAGNNPDTMLSIGHTGANGIFYIDITPGEGDDGARAGRYGIDVDISNFYNYDAPVLFDAQIVTQ